MVALLCNSFKNGGLNSNKTNAIIVLLSSSHSSSQFCFYCCVRTEDYTTLPWYKKAGQWICGIEKLDDQPELTPEQQKALERKQNSIHETKTWKTVLNVNAVLLMTLAIFVWGFYA